MKTQKKLMIALLSVLALTLVVTSATTAKADPNKTPTQTGGKVK